MNKNNNKNNEDRWRDIRSDKTQRDFHGADFEAALRRKMPLPYGPGISVMKWHETHQDR